jgi:hypothetical protein
MLLNLIGVAGMRPLFLHASPSATVPGHRRDRRSSVRDFCVNQKEATPNVQLKRTGWVKMCLDLEGFDWK